jgi:hypothetical protein
MTIPLAKLAIYDHKTESKITFYLAYYLLLSNQIFIDINYIVLIDVIE